MKRGINAFAYTGDELTGNNNSSNDLRNPVRYGFLIGPGCKCVIDTLASAGIIANKSAGKRSQSAPEARFVLTDEPNECTVGYLSGYNRENTVCLSVTKMLNTSENDGKQGGEHAMLFFIDSEEGLLYGIRFEKIRAVDPLMEMIYRQENNPMDRRNLAPTNWDYFINRAKRLREDNDKDITVKNKDNRSAKSLKNRSGENVTHCVMDGERLKFRADLIIEIPHGTLCTYKEELSKTPIAIK